MSIRFQADADLNCDIVTAVRRREPAIDFATAADAELEGMGDPQVLERARSENRILVSHDRRTMIHHFRRYLEAGGSSPGLPIVSQNAPIGPVVEAIVVLWSVSGPSEWRDQVHHLPSLTRHVTR
ncbi:conserved hypothetical protein [Candidatus Sulfopaludibacter sp. SbA4]|nr:conserved hypothetical protein [Candidatus Sulfopaludibacter sp. SbA4]